MAIDQPLISVVMSVYNAENYLYEAIDSIIKQTYKNFELIIIDDGSTDKSLTISERCAKRDERIKLINNRKNRGIAHSRNLGLSLAEGMFIAVMDADDICMPERFEKQVDFFFRHPEIDVCGTAYRELIDSNIGELITLPQTNSEIVGHLLFFCPLTHSTVMYRRDVFIKNELFYDPFYKTALDYDLWSRAFQKVQYANIDDDLLLYRVHKKQISSTNRIEQEYYTNHVIANLLSQLGVSYTEAEFAIHLSIYWRRYKNSPSYINRTFKWLDKLGKANAHTNLFPKTTFNNTISEYKLQIDHDYFNKQCISNSDVSHKRNMKKNNTPKVSIIMPFFNSKKFITEAIESVLNQTYQDWELILIDDGSTDGSTDISLTYENKFPDKIIYLQHKDHKNHGASASRNLGFKNSKGKIILYLDSDDVILPQKLDIYISKLESDPQADAIFGETLFWHSWTNNPEDQTKNRVWNPWKAHGLQENSLIKPPILLYHLLANSVMPCLHSLLLRRNIIEAIGGWEDDYKYTYEDQIFFVKLFLNATIYIIPDCLDLYRQHHESWCSLVLDTGQNLHDKIYFLNWVEKYLARIGFQDEQINKYLNHSLDPYRHPNLEKVIVIPPPIGLKNWGDLHRVTPVSQSWGFDRGIGKPGQPIDRYYIENFLENHSEDIKGCVIEIGDPGYTLRFGGDRVTSSNVLDANPQNEQANLIFDLAVGGENFPKEQFDCFLLIQTILLIYDVESAIKNAYDSIKPGGVLLATIPGISQICRIEMKQWGDYWRFTDASVRKLFGKFFGQENIAVETYGNVLSASAFLFELSSIEMKTEELDFNDPDYQVIIAIRAVKQSNNPAPLSMSQELNEIKNSKAWKLALLFRRIRYFIFPESSHQLRTIKRVGEFLRAHVKQVKYIISNQKANRLIKKFELFDQDWYLEKNPDIAQANIEASKHYLLFGGFEGRNPSPYFDSSWYLENNPDVKQAGINPLLHYVRYGKNEGRSAKPVSTEK